MRAISRYGFLFPFLACTLGAAEAELLGRVLGKVACTADATQTYALYVPSNYTKEKVWPVIYCFDPGARGLAPVERLKAAAEKFGYIVAGSNNSRNGPWEANEAAIQAMTRDVAAHLAVDRRRVYVAGLSGGARVAVQLALVGYAKGVIACSAGFPTQGEGVPPRVPFPFFGTAGTEDFNYREMKQLDADLDDRSARHRIVIFNGGHEWAPAELLTSAVEWLELQAMRAETRSRDEALIKIAWQTRLAAVPVSGGLERWRELKSLAVDFKGLADTGEVENQAKKLAGAPEVKAGLKTERALIAREGALLEQIEFAVGRNAAAKQKLVAELRAKAEAAEDSPEGQMVRRVLASYFYFVREDVRDLFASRDYKRAAEILELAVELRPGQSRTWFDLARARASSRDAAGALAALRRSAEVGFSDAGRAEADPAFEKLKADPSFQEILVTIRANPPEPERRPGEGGRRFP
jgi:dienelactone hydrolase